MIPDHFTLQDNLPVVLCLIPDSGVEAAVEVRDPQLLYQGAHEVPWPELTQGPPAPGQCSVDGICPDQGDQIAQQEEERGVGQYRLHPSHLHSQLKIDFLGCSLDSCVS